MKRTQIYLDAEQSTELGRRAAARGTTTSKVIREAIDRYLAEPDDTDDALRRFRTALDDSFGIAPYLADGASYVDELRHTDAEREDELRDRSGE